MYVPASFSETDRARLHALIEAHSFGLLVSQHGDAPFATHVPMLVDRSSGPHGALVGHMARANPHWQSAEGQTVLAVFGGPHAYISPTWYEAEGVVPTWNYVAVHAYGTFRVVRDEQATMRIVDDMVRHYEASMPRPWTLDTGSDFVRKMLMGIVGFRIELTRLEGKLKLGQNHPHDRREKVVRALSDSPNENDRRIAALMSGTLKVDRE